MLGLDAIDKKCLYLLRRRSYHASNLAEVMQVNRSTIMYRLKRLAQRRLIEPARSKERIHKGNVVYWTARHAVRTSKAHTHVFHGHDFTKAYHLLFQHLKSGDTMYVIQGTSMLEHAFRVIPRSTIYKAHAVHKRKRITIKSIVHKDIYRVFRKLDSPTLQSHIDRSIGARVFMSKARFSGNGEIIATSGIIIIVNPVKRHAVVMRDSAMVELVYEAMGLLFDMAEQETDVRSIDLNDYLKRLLKERGHAVK